MRMAFTENIPLRRLNDRGSRQVGRSLAAVGGNTSSPLKLAVRHDVTDEVLKIIIGPILMCFIGYCENIIRSCALSWK